MLISSLSLPRDLYLLEGEITCVRRSEVHLLTARRNAWNSTTINQYKTSSAIFTNATSARKAAERQRKPGTYFEIAEIPSLVFDLAQRSLVVCQLNASPLFRSWNIPKVMIARDYSMTGIEVFNMFAGGSYRESVSGWRYTEGEPDVILGTAEGNPLASSQGRGQLQLERSSVESGGWMSFSVVRKTRANPTHIERVIGELGHLTQQQLRVNEVAARFHVTSAHVLDMLRVVGSPAKSNRSWVDVAAIDQIRPLARKLLRERVQQP
ncbi:hypothetical protein JOE31_003552 [Arthrobacter sp. PvP023]|uniref:hypothetical protein n=1 Tax=Micrococcaceae TaxID=1268 RepID=UPI001AE5A697|nr:hypothetical protein [Arthrobacter sp. PvP023]MBP1137320.1 hypothetical protein [Arthrobacter sp. PvP023]